MSVWTIESRQVGSDALVASVGGLTGALMWLCVLVRQFILAGSSDSDFEEDPRVTRDTVRAGEELARAMEVN